MNTEQSLLELAIQAVGLETGLTLNVEKNNVKHGRQLFDGLIRIPLNDSLRAFEIKNNAQHLNEGILIKHIKDLPQRGLLVADYINPSMAERLRQNSVEFIDTMGNAYINEPPIYIYVSGKRKKDINIVSARDDVIRAFEPKGLKVVFSFLCDPNFVDAPYREIADKTNVSVGTVGWVINGLKNQGLLRQRGSLGSRRITNYRKLLNRWVEAYPQKLRPKQKIGEFLSDNPFWWKNVDIQSYDGCWSGEVATAQLTAYLKPQAATLYLPLDMKGRFILENRLKKADKNDHNSPGAVSLYQPFWSVKKHEIRAWFQKGLAHPILIYADLVATADARNLEAAQGIYDEFISEYCRED